MSKPRFVYVIYLRSSPAAVWDALTDAHFSAAYWGHQNVSDWRPGSRWEHQRTDGSGIADVVGTVEEAMPPRRLVTTWRAPGADAQPASRVTFDVEGWEGLVRLRVTHEELADESELAEAAAGWAAVLSNLKSLIETGHTLPRPPWEMPASP